MAAPIRQRPFCSSRRESSGYQRDRSGQRHLVSRSERILRQSTAAAKSMGGPPEPGPASRSAAASLRRWAGRSEAESPLGVTSPLVLPVGDGPGPSPGAGVIRPGSWILSQTTINGSGRVVGQSGGIGSNGQLGLRVSANGGASIPGVGACPGVKVPPPGTPRGASVQTLFASCARHLGLRNLVTYQPASRYWAFQWYETAIFVAMALALAALCFWRVRHRLT